jgi:hypothetical protein
MIDPWIPTESRIDGKTAWCLTRECVRFMGAHGEQRRIEFHTDQNGPAWFETFAEAAEAQKLIA